MVSNQINDWQEIPQDRLTQLVPDKAPAPINDWQEIPQVGAIEDTAKSIGSNLVGGGIDIAMALPNIVNQMVAGPQMLYRGIRDTFQGNPVDNSPLFQPLYGSNDVEKAIGTDYQPQTTAGKIASLPARIAGGVAGAKGLQKIEPSLTELVTSNKSGATPQPKQITSEDKFAKASQVYKEAEKQGATLYPKSTNKFIDSASEIMPQTEAGKIVSGETASSKLVERLQSLRDKHLDLKSAQEIDSALSDAMSGETNPMTGKLTAEGTKIFKIQQSLRDTIENASANDLVGGKTGFDTWKDARKLWADAAKIRDVENIITRADMTDNSVTSLKTGFRNLAINIRKGKIKGYNTQEIAAINRAARTGITTDILRIAGSRLGPLIAGGAGMATAGPLGAGAAFASDYAMSGVARNIAGKLQAKRANDVLNMIANRGAPSVSIPQRPSFPSGYDQVMSPVASSTLNRKIY